MSYTKLKILILSFFLLYTFAAIRVNYTVEGEKYPFFSWFVYSKVPQRFQTVYTLRITQYEDQKFNPPLALIDALGTYLDNTLAMANYQFFVRSLVNGITQRDKEVIQHYRSLIEQRFLSSKVIYEIVESRRDILNDKIGNTQEEKVIVAFSTHEGEL